MATIAVTELVSTVSLMIRVTMSLLASAPELLCKSYIAILSAGVGKEKKGGQTKMIIAAAMRVSANALPPNHNATQKDNVRIRDRFWSF